MSQLTRTTAFGAVSKVAQDYARQVGGDDDLSAGVSAGFGVVSYRGKVWRIKHRGEERDVMRPDGDGPANSLEFVIVKAAPVISKIFYEEGYQEGSSAPPDCWSTDGIRPDPASPKKQCQTCAGCPQNAWGSKVTPAGKAGKACADSKRLAVVPLGDIQNEAMGGPLLLRVPAASLQDLASYGKKMQGLGYPYFAIGTRIAFDTKEAYPKFVFSAIRTLSDDEAAAVIAWREDPQVARILNEAVEAVHAEPEGSKADAIASAFEQPPVQAPAPAPQPAAPKAAAPKPAAKSNGTPLPTAKAPPAAAKAAPPAHDPETGEISDEIPAFLKRDKATPKDEPAPEPFAEAAAGPDGFEDLLDDLLS